MTTLSFEEGIKRVEQIIETLERKDVSLEDALTLFEEGIELIKHCYKQLNHAEKRMQILLEGEDGELKVEQVSIEQTVLFQEG